VFGRTYPLDVSVAVSLTLNSPVPATFIPAFRVILPDTCNGSAIVIVFVYPVHHTKLKALQTLVVVFTVQFGDVSVKVATLPSEAVGTVPKLRFVAVPRLLSVVPLKMFAAILLLNF